ncbi:MAG: homoserine kinase [Armatimonadetes bacterium]|nr:homoserine kinase [Armatimonadota bacterium]
MQTKFSSVSVRVPASSANLGPGFDTLGMAISLYNTWTFRPSLDDLHHVTGFGEAIDSSHTNDSLILEAAQELAMQYGFGDLPPLSIEADIHIPVQRGLGSSASAVVGGLLGANKLFGFGASRDQLLTIAYAMEGHADNAAAALFGGVECVTTGRDNVGPLLFHRAVPVSPVMRDKVSLVACVPAKRIGTDASRRVLPRTVAFENAAFSINRLALLMIAFVNGEPDLLRYGLADDLHQPYRWKEIKGLTEAIGVAVASGDYGTCLSGSGSTLLSFCPSDEIAAQVGAAMRTALEENGTPIEAIHVLRMDTAGATVHTEPL